MVPHDPRRYGLPPPTKLIQRRSPTQTWLRLEAPPARSATILLGPLPFLELVSLDRVSRVVPLRHSEFLGCVARPVHNARTASQLESRRARPCGKVRSSPARAASSPWVLPSPLISTCAPRCRSPQVCRASGRSLGAGRSAAHRALNSRQFRRCLSAGEVESLTPVLEARYPCAVYGQLCVFRTDNSEAIRDEPRLLGNLSGV